MKKTLNFYLLLLLFAFFISSLCLFSGMFRVKKTVLNRKNEGLTEKRYNYFTSSALNIVSDLRKERDLDLSVNVVKSEEVNKFSSDDISFLFAGDVMLDRYNRTLMDKNKKDYLISELDFSDYMNDFFVVNLEGSVSDLASRSVGSKIGSHDNYYFTFNPDHTESVIKNLSIDLLNLGNNHILNFGLEGLNQTVKILDDRGFDYFGDPKKQAKDFFVGNFSGEKIVFLNYNQFGERDFKSVLKRVEELDSLYELIVVYAHWGVEYDLLASLDQQDKAHQLIDAGVDLIVGSHPHVVQNVDFYKDKAIFYSLGNFIFDQYFSEDTRLGLLLRANLDRNMNGFKFDLLPTYLRADGKTVFAEESKKDELLKRILIQVSEKNKMSFFE